MFRTSSSECATRGIALLAVAGLAAFAGYQLFSRSRIARSNREAAETAGDGYAGSDLDVDPYLAEAVRQETAHSARRGGRTDLADVDQYQDQYQEAFAQPLNQ